MGERLSLSATEEAWLAFQNSWPPLPRQQQETRAENPDTNHRAEVDQTACPESQENNVQFNRWKMATQPRWGSENATIRILTVTALLRKNRRKIHGSPTGWLDSLYAKPRWSRQESRNQRGQKTYKHVIWVNIHINERASLNIISKGKPTWSGEEEIKAHKPWLTFIT